MVERRRHLRRSPFLSHACARLWVAERQGRPVGRISAQIDELYLERYSDKSGYFGFIEAPDDAETFAALFQTAEDWLRERGMRRAIGPFSFSINDECGLLIDGFDTPPMFMMGHARPYYDSRIQEQGYRKATDTVAYIIDPRATPPPVMSASVERLQASRVRIRPFRLKHMREDLAILRDVFNDAWANNWGFVPFTTSELDDLGGSLKLFIPPELIQIAEVDGRAVGIIVAVPNLNEILSDLGGRLLPLGWLRLLWRLKRHAVKSGRVPIMGVRREMQRSALGMALVFALIEAVREPVCRYGFERVELSWTLEGNRPMHHIKQRLGARAYKTYRLYEKALA
jgi:GNAT superfamily N-acetyltransferase